MKTAEDEAFEEIERRQGGGFPAKRAMAADKLLEPVECLDCGSNNVGIPATYDSLVDSVKSQPAQEPEYEYLIDDLAEWKQYVEVDNAPYGLREHIVKVLLAHGIKEKNT